MNIPYRLLGTCAFLLALALLLSGPSPAATTAKASVSSKDACLKCHGPYDKLISATSDYLMQDGDKQIKRSPHGYLPHDSKDIPECSECHQPHPVPLTSKEGLPKADVKWCYMCHHTGDLQCGTCHR